jgi:hypothetical protein
MISIENRITDIKNIDLGSLELDDGDFCTLQEMGKMKAKQYKNDTYELTQEEEKSKL